MTDAQCKVLQEQSLADNNYKRRAFRKKCVTLGIVQFFRRNGYYFYEMHYRGCFVCTLYRHERDKLKLLSVWNTIEIAEETIKEIEGVKYEN